MNDIIQMIPDPDSLPVAPFWFVLLLYVTYYLHLISAGIMFGISVQVVIGYFKGKTDIKWKPFARTMSKILPFTIAFAVNLGVAPLLFLQVLYGNFFYTASIVMGIPWILLAVLLIVSYYSIYWVVFKKGNKSRHRLTLSLLAAALFAWIAFLLVNVNTLMMVPKNWKIYFSSTSGMNLNLTEPTLFPRYLFYLFLFILIGGIFTSVLFKIKDKKEEADLGFLFGSFISGYFSILSVPAFILFILMLPVDIKNTLLKADLIWTGLIMIFIIGFFAVSYLSFKRKTLISATLLAMNLILFVLIRNHIRYLYLKPFKEKFPAIAKVTQYDVMILFFVVLVLGLVLVFWLLRKTAGEYKKF